MSTSMKVTDKDIDRVWDMLLTALAADPRLDDLKLELHAGNPGAPDQTNREWLIVHGPGSSSARGIVLTTLGVSRPAAYYSLGSMLSLVRHFADSIPPSPAAGSMWEEGLEPEDIDNPADYEPPSSSMWEEPEFEEGEATHHLRRKADDHDEALEALRAKLNAPDEEPRSTTPLEVPEKHSNAGVYLVGLAAVLGIVVALVLVWVAGAYWV